MSIALSDLFSCTLCNFTTSSYLTDPFGIRTHSSRENFHSPLPGSPNLCEGNINNFLGSLFVSTRTVVPLVDGWIFFWLMPIFAEDILWRSWIHVAGVRGLSSNSSYWVGLGPYLPFLEWGSGICKIPSGCWAPSRSLPAWFQLRLYSWFEKLSVNFLGTQECILKDVCSNSSSL